MEKYVLFLFGLVFFSFQYSEPTSSPVGLDTVNKNDKEYIMTYLETTAHGLENSVRGLSKKQLQFKPSEESWSISQCLEHIIATEKMFFGLTIELMEKPENEERKAEIQVTDDQLLKWVLDRKEKVKSPETLQPKGTYASARKGIKEFRTQRRGVKDHLATYNGNLRNHITDSPAGAIDAHQSLLFIAGHTARHTAQIEEIKGHPGFPKK